MDGLKQAKTWAQHCSCNQLVSVTRFYLGLIVCNTEETAAYNRDEQELY